MLPLKVRFYHKMLGHWLGGVCGFSAVVSTSKGINRIVESSVATSRLLK